MTCPRCGHENLPRAKFCSECGNRLERQAASAAEERKVVTVLFADIVGFTARSDEADPEDVKAFLRPYHARLKEEIERKGGTVDKFIGDGVLAVFGAPRAHEDDPERAVLAALSIKHAIEELNEARRRRSGSRRGSASTPARWWCPSPRAPSSANGSPATW